MTDALHHPAVQSLALPLLLSLLAMALLQATAGPALAPWGALLGLLGAWAWVPGLDWPAPGRAQKLPWLALLALALVLLQAWPAWRRARPLPPWLAGGLVALLALAGLGLAVHSGLGGSLLLAQMGVALATCLAALGAWLWMRRRTPAQAPAAVPAALLLAFGVCLLGLAWAVAAGVPTMPADGDDLYLTPTWQ